VITLAVAAPFHFDPGSYGDDVVDAIHDYDDLQAAVVAELLGPGLAPVAGLAPARILELGVGTGETTRRILGALPDAHVIGVDASPAMLAAAARSSLAAFEGRFEPRAATLQEPLPDGEFDAVVSALTVHHLDAQEKSDLFSRVHKVLSPTGTFVLADVVLPGGEGSPNAGESRPVELTDGFDKPSTAADQVRWLLDCGFSVASVVWRRDDLAVIVARA
jgi:tRNA (cmo5U34)-methyltransferase